MSSPCPPRSRWWGRGLGRAKTRKQEASRRNGYFGEETSYPCSWGEGRGGGQTKHQANRRPRGGNVEHQLGGMTERGHPRTRAEQTFQR